MINPKSIYSILLQISKGDFTQIDRLKYDDILYGISLNKNNPGVSTIKLVFSRGEYMDLFKKLADNEWEISFAQDMLSGYYGNLDVYDWEIVYENWKDGYHLGESEIGTENYNFLKEKILPLLGMSVNTLEENKSEIAVFLDDLYGKQVSRLLEEIQEVQNECSGETIRGVIIKDLCDILFSHGIYRKDCFHIYFATVGTLLRVYSKLENKNVDIQTALTEYIKDNVKVDINYEEHRYDFGCSNDHFDNSPIVKNVEKFFDYIYENLTEPFENSDPKEFYKLYKEIDNKFVFNTVNTRKVKTEKFYRYKIVGIDKPSLKIIVDVWEKSGYESGYPKEEPKRVMMTKEQFYNFVYHPVLFDE
jgi:hypothetical protein